LVVRSLNKNFLFSLTTKFFVLRLPRPIPRRFLVCGAVKLRFCRVACKTSFSHPAERLVIAGWVVHRRAKPKKQLRPSRRLSKIYS